MSRDDIIRMAQEADLHLYGEAQEAGIERFFHLAASAGAEAEREACAAFLDRGVDLSDLAEHPAWQRYSADLLTACAAAIRSRKP